MTHPFLAGPLPRVLAHRGLVTAEAAASGIAENSLAAIAAAHAVGADIVESDCHLTADGTVVLFHDSDLSRVTGDPRRLSEVTTVELEALMRERGGLAVLADTLDAFPTVRFNLDVKADAAAEPVGRLVAPHAARVLVTSFDDARRRRALAAAEAAGGEPATSAGSSVVARAVGASAVRLRRAFGRAVAGVDALQVPVRQGPVPVVTRRLIDDAHAHSVEVHVWTINDPGEMTRLVTLGVDGIVTDRADAALHLLRRARS
ncbi:MAG: glycerophosphodiester phosphodiesterase [Microbacterium ginsengisoli]|uniref:glycerophosphodiester phosphodiesterase family protein n=1 Tax=Microbacterium TaxID=33882 RepID=UPI0006FB971D|nr:MULTISPECIES: glycerophosphodiester phosphodiesterase family protein [unclassified Microbacterium]MBN9197491.1 glycerophosphodiester phosphodiesterase [Microbacterium ginsengisoli]KQR93165.1 glycerophosphodiester phosphodiesterase [Microbacterium sp. Leaf351]KQS05440.1 glycerophosphodiester phosphodiesterase [Microbacterium sp. Leaf347]ODU76371.1 MAG: glycerophosphodiester phosphodiesterase [Microbacterium sp. SCN 71-21]OJU77391.1 MAG: glycerophosphodiester phosphodiesterase [Microbacterium